MTTNNREELMHIEAVAFKRQTSRHGNTEVIATLEDSKEIVVFAFFDDELAFRAEEIVNLNVMEAKALKRRRELEFIAAGDTDAY